MLVVMEPQNKKTECCVGGSKKMPEGFVTMRTQLGRNVDQSIEHKTSPQMVSMAEIGS